MDLGEARSYLDHHYIRLCTGSVNIEEVSSEGAGIVTFKPLNKAVSIRSKAGTHQVRWLENQKCADGAFIEEVGGKYFLHIIELKSTLNDRSFEHAMRQMSGMYLNALCLARLIGIQEFAEVICYIAYCTERISVENSASTVLFKPSVTPGATSIKVVWMKEEVSLPLSVKSPLKKIQRDVDGNAVFAMTPG